MKAHGIDEFGCLYIVERAFRSAFVALDAVVNGEPLSDASFPTYAEVMQILASAEEGTGFMALRMRLNEIPDPPPNSRTQMMFL